MANNQFANKEMRRCGWSEGKGLGKGENGMKDAIKVKRKGGTGGLGHNEGTDFSFHWWDHIFNKAANSFDVAEDEDGAALKKCEGKKITPYLISNKKPLSSNLAHKELLYGTFVKSGTYKDPVCKKDGSSSDNDTSDDDDSSDVDSGGEETINDTLERTFRKTGLTGHKAARHGHQLSGKLQRINEQEAKQTLAAAAKRVAVSLDDKSKEEKIKDVKDGDKCNQEKSTNETKKEIKKISELVENQSSDSGLKSKDDIKNSDTCNEEKVKKKKKKCKVDMIDNSCNDAKLCEDESEKTKKKKRETATDTKLNLPIDEISTKELDNSHEEIIKKKKKKKSSVVEMSEKDDKIQTVVKLKKEKRKLSDENVNFSKDEPTEKKKKKKKNLKEKKEE